MAEKTVREIMVNLAEYAVVPEEATLFEAVAALEEAQQKFDSSLYRHRAILVQDHRDRIVGKLSQLDVLRALEPGYKQMNQPEGASRYGSEADFVRLVEAARRDFGLWQKPLDDICRKAGDILVKDVMYAPTEGEYVEADYSVNTAIHRLVMGRHQSLLVTENGRVVGILRLTDVFHEVWEAMKSCQIRTVPE